MARDPKTRLPLLQKLLAVSRVVAVDIGARGGFTNELISIAPAVEAIGFEPDQTECDRLNARAGEESAGAGLRSLRYVPTAVGRESGERILNLYRKRGCSSLLTADADFAAAFAREDYFVLEGQVPVNVERLDDAARRFNFADAHFLKIDIQGAELEAFQSGPKLVGEALLCIRTEVEFAPLYVKQPLFADVDSALRAQGFMLGGLPVLHTWRRGTRVRNDAVAPGPVPMSEGQLIHGDALYFRRPETMPSATPADQDRLICLALLSFALGHLDLCAGILSDASISRRIKEEADVDVSALIAEIGAWHAARRKRQIRDAALRRWRDLVR
jgi:FkbM family methyltransferase